MAGIAEGLLEVLRWLAGTEGVRAEMRQRIEEWRERCELPSLPALAELLEQSPKRIGFSDLEALCSGPRGSVHVTLPSAKVSPRLLISRLDLGLRFLRAETGVSQAAVAAAAAVDRVSLSRWERPDAGEKPTVTELDRFLEAVGASYLDLERTVKDPLRAFRALHRREKRAQAVTLGGRAMPQAVTARLDVALRLLRLRRGWTRRELAAKAGVAESRLLALESRGQGAPPTEEELASLMEALGASQEELVEATENPLRDFERLAKRFGKLERELRRKGPTVIAGRKVPSVVTERFDLALQGLRARKGWSRRDLAERADLAPERVVALETRGRSRPPTVDEVKRLRMALEAAPADFEDAARYPLRGAARLGRRVRKLETQIAAQEEELARARSELEAARKEPGEPAGPVFETAWRLAESVERFRRSRAEDA